MTATIDAEDVIARMQGRPRTRLTLPLPVETPMVRAIIKACARHCGASVQRVKSTDKGRSNARARLLAFHLLRSKLGFLAREIAPIFKFSVDGVWDATSTARRKQPSEGELAQVWAKAKAQLLRENENALRDVEFVVSFIGDSNFVVEWRR